MERYRDQEYNRKIWGKVPLPWIYKPGNYYINEHYDSRHQDIRFLKDTIILADDVGSKKQEIEGDFGTSSQKIEYPKYTDLIKYGVAGPNAKPVVAQKKLYYDEEKETEIGF